MFEADFLHLRSRYMHLVIRTFALESILISKGIMTLEEIDSVTKDFESDPDTAAALKSAEELAAMYEHQATKSKSAQFTYNGGSENET